MTPGMRALLRAAVAIPVDVRTLGPMSRLRNSENPLLHQVILLF
jgi:hypothetical protein